MPMVKSIEKRKTPLCSTSAPPAFGSSTRHSTGSPTVSASVKRSFSVFSEVKSYSMIRSQSPKVPLVLVYCVKIV